MREADPKIEKTFAGSGDYKKTLIGPCSPDMDSVMCIVKDIWLLAQITSYAITGNRVFACGQRQDGINSSAFRNSTAGVPDEAQIKPSFFQSQD